MKYTKKALRAALKADNQTEVRHLIAVKLGRKPTRKEVCDLIEDVANTVRDSRKSYTLAFQSQRKQRLESAELMAWYRRGAYGQYGDAHYRTVALEMLRRLHDEDHGSYTKVPMIGHTRLYFCSPFYGHADYNKVRTCNIKGNEDFCKTVVDLGERIYSKKAK